MLDAIGPYEVLRSVPGWEVTFVAPEAGVQRADSGAVGLVADSGLDEVTEPDIVLVGGGAGNRALMEDEAVLDWLRSVDAESRWTTSVCTGSLVLGAAGLLEGKRATSHWLFLDQLREFGAEPSTRARGRGRQADHLRRGVGRDRHGPADWSCASSAPRQRRRYSWRSSTTRSPHSTPAPQRRRRRPSSRRSAPPSRPLASGRSASRRRRRLAPPGSGSLRPSPR